MDLNRSGLHLNFMGTNRLANNFLDCISLWNSNILPSLTFLNENYPTNENLFCVNDGISEDSDRNELDPSNILKNLKLKNVNRLIIGHLNINSISSKIELLKAIVQDYIDILVISETKLDESYSYNMFDIKIR